MAIALVGLPGSGKTAVGKRLAQRLQCEFIDSDHLIEARIGCSIRDFFEREGEERFRDVEQDVLAGLARDPQGVLSTGGGSVLRAANRQALGANFHVIYLRSSPEDLYRRLRHDVKRPLLQVADPMARLRELHRQRDPLYREVAHQVVETGRPSVSALVGLIARDFEGPETGAPPADGPAI